MLKEGKILLGKAGDLDILLQPDKLNRHGLIAGATGTGKTVTAKVIIESLSEMGVPTFIADIKGDLTGMVVEGNQESLQDRLNAMGITDFTCQKYPAVQFFDIYRDKGHPVRAILQDMDPYLISRILNLTDVQQGVLNIIFRVAEEMELDILDLKDLQAMTLYVGEHAKEYTTKYGNVSKQSIGAIQRTLLELEQQSGDLFFGIPEIDILDWMTTKDGYGMINLMECSELFQKPMLYSTFMMWFLDRIYNSLPEVGDLEQPKMVFFFDEAHLLFNNAPRQLLEKIEQTVKLIRSKGVGIFFISQLPTDIPDAVLSQLSNRIQHAMRAYTPNEIKAVKLAADSFRVNPDIDTAERITNMKTGTALVSVLDEEGAPTIVQETMIMPPRSSMEIAPSDLVESIWQNDAIFAKYQNDQDPESAFETIDEARQEELRAQEEEKLAKEEAKLAKEEEKRRKEREKNDWGAQISKKAQQRLQREVVNTAFKSAKKLLKNLLK